MYIICHCLSDTHVLIFACAKGVLATCHIHLVWILWSFTHERRNCYGAS